MLLQELMSTEILTISANDYAAEALRLMNHHARTWVIVLESDQIAGIVFLQDLERLTESTLKERDVREYLRTNLLMIGNEAHPQEAERMLRCSGMDFLTVVKNNYPVGIITQDHLMPPIVHPQAS